MFVQRKCEFNRIIAVVDRFARFRQLNNEFNWIFGSLAGGDSLESSFFDIQLSLDNIIRSRHAVDVPFYYNRKALLRALLALYCEFSPIDWLFVPPFKRNASSAHVCDAVVAKSLSRVRALTHSLYVCSLTLSLSLTLALGAVHAVSPSLDSRAHHALGQTLFVVYHCLLFVRGIREANFYLKFS